MKSNPPKFIDKASIKVFVRNSKESGVMIRSGHSHKKIPIPLLS